MGKSIDEHNLPSTTHEAYGTTQRGRNSNANAWCLGCIKLKKAVTLRCVLVLVLCVAVFLSAVFWLPFFHFSHKKDPDLDYPGHGIVASFMVKKPALFLQHYIMQLEDDIFQEMSYASTKVEIISLVPLQGSNVTKVVFAVEADTTTQSLIRSLFVDLIIHRTILRLTASLFGNPFSFDVLKFKGGITASPDQKAFLMQNDQILFNFTLNFSMDQILGNFNELWTQLKSGLHLTPYENLYIRLTNLKGSTVSPPTTVQSQVLLAVGINPSKRMKQLVQTITGSDNENLGLNNSVFGRVKQVRLSSISQHSLRNDGYGPSPSPSQQNHYHHHHHRRHIADSPSPTNISPSPTMTRHGLVNNRKKSHLSSNPVPTPSPSYHYKVDAPPPCPFGYNNRFPWKHNEHSHSVPPYRPPVHSSVAAAPLQQPKRRNSWTPKVPSVRAISPSPSVAYARGQPPSNGEYHAAQVLPIISPSHSTSSAGIFSYNIWTLLLPITLTILLL